MSKTIKRSPLAPKSFPDLPKIGGVRFSVANSGTKYTGRPDMMLAELQAGTSIAGVFTRSRTSSAPVRDCQSKLGGDAERGAAIFVNAGNANAFTGHAGEQSVQRLTTALAQTLAIPVERVFTASTGVIGERLQDEKLLEQIDGLSATLDPEGLGMAAQAIMTTDTFSKAASAQCEINGQTVQIAGIAKGSGMIAPDMATMLSYIFTDAQYEQDALQALLKRLCAQSFNAITVDSDTSTSDSLMLAATGASGVDATGDAAFEAALGKVMLDLAHQIVRDGEGATKFIEVRVRGAVSDADARQHALAIANSPLVKTAIAGEDPNWGRIVMAIGKSGAEADRDLLSIRFGDVLVAEQGWVSANYREELGADYMRRDEIVIDVDLAIGSGQATIWTCDLTHGYIEINADYRS